jgi:orotate phosphoribosyltransferase
LINYKFVDKSREIEALWRKLEKVVIDLEENPFYTYSLKRFINELEKSYQDKGWPVSRIYKHLYDLLSNFFFSICSAASGLIPLDEQKELMLFLSSCLKRLNMPNTVEKYLMFDREIKNIEDDLRNRLKSIKKVYPLSFTLQHRTIKVKDEYPQWKKDLILLINEWELFEKRNLPEFILKSGLRSFYFFNFSRLMHDPRIRQKFINCIKKGLEEFRKNKMVDIDNVLLLTKTFGEEAGTIMLSGILDQSHFSDLQLLPTTPWFDLVRGVDVEDKERPFTIIDTLTTTGGTLKEISNRLEEISCKIKAYIVFIDRSTKGLQPPERIKELKILSIISSRDLLEAGILEPEVLLGDIDHPIFLTVDLTRDTIYEICIYYDVGNEYEKLIECYSSLISKAFSGKGEDYRKFNLLKDDEKFRNIIANILILSYNSLKKKHLPFLSSLDGIEYLKYIEETERKYLPVLSRIRGLLFNEFKSYNNVSIHDVIETFAIRYRKLSSNLFRYVQQYIMKIPKEKFTEEELQKLAKKAVYNMEELLKNELGSRYKPKTQKEIEEQIQHAYNAYKCFNEVFGKPESYCSKIAKER